MKLRNPSLCIEYPYVRGGQACECLQWLHSLGKALKSFDMLIDAVWWGRREGERGMVNRMRLVVVVG